MQKGYVHIYTGDGKGKTTAAVGLATRALGQQLKVVFFQFLKSGFTGEMMPLVKAGCMFIAPQGSAKFVWDMNEAEKASCAERQSEALARARSMWDKFDLLVLDEVICAVQEGMLPRQQLMDFIAQRPAGLELVLTGRGADEALIAQADYATEMKCIKHPYNAGLQARAGVEF